MTNILETKNLHYTYPDGTKALKGINLTIKEGEKVAIMGANGSGKSTFFLHLNGIIKPEKGEVLFRGAPIDYSRKGLLHLRSQVGIVFQNPDNQLFSASVIQELSFGPLNLGLDEEETKKRVEGIMERLNIAYFQEKPTHFLSGGQKKRVSIGDVLVMEPKVILLDEPTAELDPKHGKKIDDIIEALGRENITLLISTHDVNRALAWADKVILFREGEIDGEGSPEEIFSRKELLQRNNLETPSIYIIHEAMQEANMISKKKNWPKTVDQLVENIQKKGQ